MYHSYIPLTGDSLHACFEKLNFNKYLNFRCTTVWGWGVRLLVGLFAMSSLPKSVELTVIVHPVSSRSCSFLKQQV